MSQTKKKSYKKKVKAVVQGKKNSPIMQRKQSLRQWFYEIDWAVWWDLWYLGLDDRNQYIYPTLLSFATAKSDTMEQRDFLMWYLGPNDPMDKDLAIEQQKYQVAVAPNLHPQAWLEKRTSGGWFHEKSRKALEVEIGRRMHALDSLRETGRRFGIHFLARADELAQKVDEFFKGSPMLPGLSLEANMYRAKQYLELHERLLKYYSRAQDLFAKSNGVCFDDLEGLVKLMEATAMSAQSQLAGEGKALTPIQASVAKFAEVALAKAGKYPSVAALLPSDVIDATAEAVSEAVQAAEAKKKVQ